MRFLKSLLSRSEGQRGQSIIEALMSIAILGIVAQSTTLVVQAMARQNVGNRDKAFATEKALQMLEELRELVLTDSATLTTLDNYADGRGAAPSYTPFYKYTLTTKYSITGVNTPSTANTLDAFTATDPHSANPIRSHGYAFVRNVDVWSTTQDANVRMIYVRVYAAAPNAGYGTSITAMAASTNAPPLAEVYGMVHSLGTVVPPSQVLDMYFIALENVPGWWTRTSNLIPLMQSSIISLQAMNPGLVIRSHWIQTMSFGRDLEYTPEVNPEGTAANTTGAFDEAYVYPGTVAFDTGNDYYYLPSWFLGRVDVGGALPGKTGWPTDMYSPNMGYAMADQFNHAMRYPDELNLYNVLCTIAENNGSAVPQISYRMLLEKLNQNDPTLQNAIILNLHGEMVPVPPIRNYSDAAKDPDWYGNTVEANSRHGIYGLPARSYRAVTQPEQLYYNYTNQPLQAVNVYAYDANPSEIVSDTPVTETVDTITLYMPNATINNLYEIQRIQGNSATPYYRYTSGTAAAGGGFNYYVNGTYTAITDSPNFTTSTATFWADNYSPVGRASSGLRIMLFGTTPTARTYHGPEQ